MIDFDDDDDDGAVRHSRRNMKSVITEGYRLCFPFAAQARPFESLPDVGVGTVSQPVTEIHDHA